MRMRHAAASGSCRLGAAYLRRTEYRCQFAALAWPFSLEIFKELRNIRNAMTRESAELVYFCKAIHAVLQIMRSDR